MVLACCAAAGYTFADAAADAVMGCGVSKPHALQGETEQRETYPGPVLEQALHAPVAAPEPAPSASESTPPPAKSPAPEALVAAPATAASSWDDWDDEDDSATPTRSQAQPPAVAGATPQPTEHAAFRNGSGVLCIGAGAMEVGLRCTACGQRVHRFEAYRWDESADYYTFR
eukprot:CAMPEP_0119060776 /NCGR_PEP_ID=MMETSP1178-20130426/4694_1 /TAXON_ID=33656 /ORGANISM="unid sp, Strain CCMP2000" /LENGTH=171 /DNA_ID=CAMNT_0007041913 /DNA_START=19 /DNA_END=532 /DNA_ORIENTATION=-